MDRIGQLITTRLFDAMVPRYTSYPTAPHFSSDVGPADLARWLSELPDDATISLYIHIPFCERLCWFCACRTQGTRTHEPVAAYVDTLCREIAILAGTRQGRLSLSRIHWGGGTPTILKPDQIHTLCDAISTHFDIAEDCEFSVEIDPTLVDKPKLAALAQRGMNRASIGIQDFDPSIQKAIGRDQSFELTRRVVGMIRDAGVQSLNTDIVYGLPGQTLYGIGRSTESLLELEPDRVALFGYAHVPWVAKRQRMIDESRLPDPLLRLALVEQCESQFADAGYRALGIDHFALPADALAVAGAERRMRRNFQGYTDDAAPVLLGLGASAISSFPQGYAQNAPATAAYTGRIRAGEAATVKGFRLSLEDKVRARLIERFLCDLEFSLGDLRADFGSFADLVKADFDRVAKAFGAWLDLDGDGMKLRPEGKPLARLIASEFDTYYQRGQARHSAAI